MCQFITVQYVLSYYIFGPVVILLSVRGDEKENQTFNFSAITT